MNVESIPEAAWQSGGEVDDAAIATPLIATLEAVVRARPDAMAIADPDRVLTYRELWNAAMALAGELAAATSPGDRIGVRLPAGVTFGVAILACLAAGRISMALDPADPPTRAADLLRGAEITVALGESNQAAAPVRWRALDALETAGPIRAARPHLAVDLPAFIVGTSGSSGVPKLIVHSQRGYAMAARRTIDLFRTTHADRSAFAGSPSTAAAGQYLFQALIPGAMALMCDVRSQGLNSFLALLAEHRATTLRVFVSMARTVATLSRARDALAHLRAVRLTGEPMLASDVALLRGVLPPGAAIINGYGASEVTATFEWIAPPGPYKGGVSVPAGTLRPGASVVLLDEAGAPCLPDVAGEVLFRSRYNAIGEWRHGRCVPGRMEPVGRDGRQTIYRTGDLGVLGPDGVLTVLGRVDRQVKVNGNRIELGEIEEAMRATPGIAAAAVVARKDAGRTMLLGFFVTGSDDVSATELRRALTGRLPPAMLPMRLIQVDSLPYLPGFKLDTVTLLDRVARELA